MSLSLSPVVTCGGIRGGMGGGGLPMTYAPASIGSYSPSSQRPSSPQVWPLRPCADQNQRFGMLGCPQPQVMMSSQAQQHSLKHSPLTAQHMQPQTQKASQLANVNPSNQRPRGAKENNCGCGWTTCPICNGGEIPNLDVSCISLGSWCGVSQCLRANKLRTEAYPFDWNRVSLDGVIHFLQTRFEDFLQYERTKDFPWDKVHGGLTYCGKYHSFWHDDLTKQEVRDKYKRRIDRLFDIPNKKLLFIRAVNESSEVPKAERLLEVLQEAFADHDVWLLVIIDHQSAGASYVVQGTQNRLLIAVTNKVHIATPLYYDDVKAYDQAILTAFRSVVGRAVTPNPNGGLRTITNLQTFAAQLEPFFSGSTKEETWHPKAVPQHGLQPDGMGRWAVTAPTPRSLSQQPKDQMIAPQSPVQQSSVREGDGYPQSSPRTLGVPPVSSRNVQEPTTNQVGQSPASLTSRTMRTSTGQPQVASGRGDVVPNGEEGIKVIFLDVDGVLVTGPGDIIVGSLLTNLKSVVQATSAKLVLSSDWRRDRHSIDVLRRSLQTHGMDIIGCTPELSPYSPQRPAELLQWIDDYRSHGGQISAWITIDDRDLLVEKQGNQLQGHFVRTNPRIGLDRNVANTCIQLLQSQSAADGFKVAASTPASPVPTISTPVSPVNTMRTPKVAASTPASPMPTISTPASPVTTMSTPVPDQTTESISLKKVIPSEYTFAEQETRLEGDEMKTMLAGKGLEKTTPAAGTTVAAAAAEVLAAMETQTVNPLGDALQHSADGGMISNALPVTDSARDFDRTTACSNTGISVRRLVSSTLPAEATATRSADDSVPHSVPDGYRNRPFDLSLERVWKRLDCLASRSKMPLLASSLCSPTSIVGTSKAPSSSPSTCLPATLARRSVG